MSWPTILPEDLSMHDDRRVPRWDPLTRELWVGDLLVKRFRQPAANQERVLAALEEEGWPRRIDDPLPGDGCIDRHDRLRETIRSLNARQLNKLIEFKRDGTGNGLTWHWYDLSAAPNRKRRG